MKEKLKNAFECLVILLVAVDFVLIVFALAK